MRGTRSIWIAALAAFVGTAVCAPAASAGDLLGSPTPLTFGSPQQENTAAYGVEGEQNVFAPFTQTCDVGREVGVARTAWFTVQGTGGPVTVSTKDSSFDTSMFVYSGSPSGALVTCSDDGPGTGIWGSATFNTASGATYAVQAGSFCDSSFARACTGPPSGGTLSILASAPGAATGQRAAALKKCKKKSSKKKRRSCKKRAKTLPL
jgi:hypothetical protein